MQWGLFIAVHQALFAGAIYIDRPMRVPGNQGAMMLYSGFAAVNYLVLAKQQELPAERVRFRNRKDCSHPFVVATIKFLST